MNGKSFLVKVASRLATYPVGQKLLGNHSISLCFRDKQVFAFNVEIQDGCQKWWENDFCKKSPVDSADTLCFKNFVEITLSRSVSGISGFLPLTQKFKMGSSNLFIKLEVSEFENYEKKALAYLVHLNYTINSNQLIKTGFIGAQNY